MQTATPKRDYYVVHRLGRRMISFRLDALALAFLGASGQRDRARIDSLAKEYRDGWISVWMKERKVEKRVLVQTVQAVGIQGGHGQMRALDLFEGRHFNREIIVLCVRWYLGFKLSSRDLGPNDGRARNCVDAHHHSALGAALI